MTRTLIEQISWSSYSEETSSPLEILNNGANEDGYHYLLAYALDGVIWGRVREKSLLLSSDYFPDVSPPLREHTLQEARLFGSEKELYIWRDSRDSSKWKVRHFQESGDKTGSAFEEKMILWGTGIQDQNTENKFTLVAEGELGIRHALPIDVDKETLSGRRCRLVVRNYLQYDKDGVAFIALTRLVDLEGGRA